MSNIKKYCAYTALYNVGLMFCSGAIIQTFLLQAGFTEQQVYVFNSLTQAAQVIMMLVMTFLASRIKRVKLVIGCSYLSLSVLATVFLLGACNPSLFGQSYVIAVFITAGFCYIGVGLYTILAYCLPYTIIDMKEYGKMTALGVLCAGASSFALSFVHTFVVARFSYMQAMAWFFILVIVCFALTTCVCLSLKEVEGRSGVIRETKDDVIAVFKNKDMYILLLPNFARGFAAGVMGVITVVATSMEIVDKQTSSYVPEAFGEVLSMPFKLNPLPQFPVYKFVAFLTKCYAIIRFVSESWMMCIACYVMCVQFPALFIAQLASVTISLKNSCSPKLVLGTSSSFHGLPTFCLHQWHNTHKSLVCFRVFSCLM